MIALKELLPWGRRICFEEIYRRCLEAGETWSPAQVRHALTLLKESRELIEVAPNQFQCTVHGHEQTRN